MMSDALIQYLRDSKGWPRLGEEAADRIEELEAKLAMAVEALGIAAEWLDDYSAFTGNTYETTKSKTVRVAIAKIKGEQP